MDNIFPHLHFIISSSINYLSLFSLKCPHWFFAKLHRCYNHLLMSLTYFHCVLKGLEYDAMISCAIFVSVSALYSKHCILINSSILPHVLYHCEHMFSSWFISIYSVDIVLYPYTLPIDHFLYSYSSLCLSCNLSQV